MKISDKSFALLKAGCEEVIAANPDSRAYYESKGLSAKRFRWDVLWASTIDGMRPSEFICSVLYDKEHLTDVHIDTALRRIVG